MPTSKKSPAARVKAAATKTKTLPTVKRRAADLAYDAIETMLSTMQLEPGSPIVEAELAERTGMGRTPVREALLRMISIDLIVQQPRRATGFQHRSGRAPGRHPDTQGSGESVGGLRCPASLGAAAQRYPQCAKQMVAAAKRGNLEEYMHEDHALDAIIHTASRNRSAVKSVTPLIVQCRRFGMPTSMKAISLKAHLLIWSWLRVSLPGMKRPPLPAPTA
jgi:DNA-binding GntR family transcriptional regulator